MIIIAHQLMYVSTRSPTPKLCPRTASEHPSLETVRRLSFADGRPASGAHRLMHGWFDEIRENLFPSGKMRSFETEANKP